MSIYEIFGARLYLISEHVLIVALLIVTAIIAFAIAQAIKIALLEKENKALKNVEKITEMTLETK